jgi:hypothetical protein
MTQVIYPVPDGHRRLWLRCNHCGHIEFRDYVRVEGTLGALSCGHGKDFEQVTADYAMPYLLAGALIGNVVGTASRHFRPMAAAG